MKSSNIYLTFVNFVLCWFTYVESDLMCSDTYGWRSTSNTLCSYYTGNGSYGWGCSNGTYAMNVTRYGGNTNKYPEFNC